MRTPGNTRRAILFIGFITLLLGTQMPGTLAQDAAPAGSVPLTGARVGDEIVVSQLDNEQHQPAVAHNWKHHEYLVVWHNTWGGAFRDIYAQRVSERGQLLSSFTVATGANDNAQPSVAYDPVNDRYLVVWSHDASGTEDDWDIWGRFIPWNGPDAGLQDFPICTWSSNQWVPEVAYGRAVEEFMVVWNNEVGSGVPMYVSAARVNASNGTVHSPFTIDSHPTEDRIRPDIAYNLARNEYLIVWESQGGSTSDDIWGLRLTGTGSQLGGGKFGIAGWPDSEEQPAVAACEKSDTYYVTWQSYHYDSSQYDVYGRFVSGSGAPGAVHHFHFTSVEESFPDVDCNYGTKEFLVTYQLQYSNAWGPFGIAAQTVSPDGLGDHFMIRPIRAGEGTTCSLPAVAGGGTHYLTVWEHARPATTFQDIHGRLSTTHPVFLPGLER